MTAERNPHVDGYVRRASRWRAETEALRAILLTCGLEERFRWGKPCYATDGSNIAIIQSMTDFLSLLFFKGILLDDPAGVLEEQGENTHAARRICLRSVEDVRRLDPTVRQLVASAVDVERQGVPLPERPEEELAAELRDALDADPELRAAFEGLTPGRQREYNLHVSGAKQASTRARRVEKCAPRILEGRGFRD